MLTGRMPFEKGVRDNAGYELRAEVRTLAEELKSDGYAAGAAVSSIVLAKATGVGQGRGGCRGPLRRNWNRRGYCLEVTTICVAMAASLALARASSTFACASASCRHCWAQPTRSAVRMFTVPSWL